ncbi:cyclic AMP-dependent transcription factor ATF-7a isoform X9 [Clupea harengus]|uniref:Cyclic AMP-dependent transcription factor ATF-7a isoform X9 n=1 Tax=Clupea harengus TaxID=7950 RepID=A0A6P8FD04_CLUHA|nr:cyclic AMP-dependent transcription factor ATF-7a isoform X9 [Clupea harengus]
MSFSSPLSQLHCKLFAKMGDDRPFVCNALGCGQRFTNEDHLAVHKHKHEMTLKFGPARTDSVIIADQTPTPTRFLKNCEEVGLFNELASSFEQEFRKAQEDDDKNRSKNPQQQHHHHTAPSTGVVDMSLQTPSEVKVKEEEPVEVDSTPPGSPESISSMSDSGPESVGRPKDTPPRPPMSAAPTPTIVRPGSLPLHLGYDALQPTMPSPTSVITPTPPSNRQLGSPTGPYPMMMLPNGQTVPVLPGPMHMPSVISLARPLMVPNIPGIPGPPLGGSSSSCSSSPSGYNLHSEAKMVSPAQPTGGRRRRTADDDPDERRQRFLERNRAAASRCRQKRKVWVNSLEKKAEELSSMNVSLSNEVGLLRNEVAHLKQLLLAHKDCPVTTRQKNAYLGGDETMKDVSEPVGSPAAVIQHSSLAMSPSSSSAGPNGMSARAAAEAVAMSVLAGMGSQRGEHGNHPGGGGGGGGSHVIMATQSQHAAR